MELVAPARKHLDSYLAALSRGWSPDNIRGEVAALEQRNCIAADQDLFLQSLDDREARGGMVVLADGSQVPRLPSITRWMWKEGFVGSLSFRWQRGTPELPASCLGHIGYAVVPWEQGKGYATAALRLILPEAMALGFPYVELTTSPDNPASQRVIEKAGGELYEMFEKASASGGGIGLRYRIFL